MIRQLKIIFTTQKGLSFKETRAKEPIPIDTKLWTHHLPHMQTIQGDRLEPLLFAWYKIFLEWNKYGLIHIINEESYLRSLNVRIWHTLKKKIIVAPSCARLVQERGGMDAIADFVRKNTLIHKKVYSISIEKW